MDPTVVRFAGLYGPDRYRLTRYLDGPVTEGYLNMVHRTDAAGVVRFALTDADEDVLLAVDDEPVSKWAFADWLADECGVSRPDKQTVEERLDEGDLSTPAERRLRTSKRCSNDRLRELGYGFSYPTYREGYRPAIESFRRGSTSERRGNVRYGHRRRDVPVQGAVRRGDGADVLPPRRRPRGLQRRPRNLPRRPDRRGGRGDGETVRAAVESGCNVVDTAINYRHQRSERVVGRALADADVDREAVFVSTKGGFVPFDGERPENPGSTFVRSTSTRASSTARTSPTAATPSRPATSRTRSTGRCATSTSTPSTSTTSTTPRRNSTSGPPTNCTTSQRPPSSAWRSGRPRGHPALRRGDVGRVPRARDHERYLDLGELISRARGAAKSVGNTATHLRAVQVPFNVYMADAFTCDAQSGPEGDQSVLWFAHEAGLNVFTSASLAQGEVVQGIPDAVDAKLSGETAAQRGLNFARSAPGVTSALAGTTNPDHVRENVAAGAVEPLGADAFDAVFE